MNVTVLRCKLWLSVAIFGKLKLFGVNLRFLRNRFSLIATQKMQSEKAIIVNVSL
ncbi:MAG: hypothetical protein AB8B53_10235 [Flavobacteriales bacterium]